MLKEWNQLPKYRQTEEVRPYYERLKQKKNSMTLKRGFDLVMSILVLIILLPAMLTISIVIVLDSKGGVFFRQERITQYGKKFRIFKFRTMVANAEQLGSQITVKNDMRVTKIGGVLRKSRIDEFPQLLNVMAGDMSFVGTRPEDVKYVEKYKSEYIATLLLPAGITSEASIRYKDEADLLDAAEDVDQVYLDNVLPQKMKYNLESIKKFSFLGEIATMFRTVFAVIGGKYK